MCRRNAFMGDDKVLGPRAWTLESDCLGLNHKSMVYLHVTSVQSLCQEDPLEKGIATHSSILAWRKTWTKEPGGLQSMESQKVRHD